MTYLILTPILLILFFFGWKLTARSAYESAAYTVILSEEAFEIRDYPDLMLASTASKTAGKDKRFMRLFRYIEGANEQEQKISMTTPVFMDPETDANENKMSFVIPEATKSSGIPAPTGEQVSITKRAGGRFAVYRFSGRLNKKLTAKAEQKLREWITKKKLTPEGSLEVAGYDPPWTPGPFRRNEILIRIQQSEQNNSNTEME